MKGLLVLLAVFCLLMGLLIFAKTRPAPGHGAALQNAAHAVTVT